MMLLCKRFLLHYTSSEFCCEQGESLPIVRLEFSRADFARELVAVENHLFAFTQQARNGPMR